MNTLKLTIEYDGTQFSGWQIQPSCRTVQEVIEQGLQQLTGEKIHITGSGRTDAGVHALGQVASFHTNGNLPLKAYKNGLNSHIPEDVRVKKVEKVFKDFNARRDARRRTYHYLISKNEHVIGRQYAWFC